MLTNIMIFRVNDFRISVRFFFNQNQEHLRQKTFTNTFVTILLTINVSKIYACMYGSTLVDET